MAYQYNPNDQRFYDQLAAMSNIDRRSTDQSQKANALKLQNERYLLEKIAQLPDDYQKGFKNKRERTPLKYGETIESVPEGVPEGDNAFYDFNTEAPLDVSATPPKDATIVEEDIAPGRFGNPTPPNPNSGASYSPGAAAVLDGLAQPGWNPPMNNPPARPAPGSWMNDTPYPSPGRSVPAMNAPMTEEEIAALEYEKKKELPAQGVTASPPAMTAEEAIKPKKNQDPRVSFRRFKANEFLQNNAVFQMDLPKIQPTYATMLAAETALAKSGKDPASQKQWELANDYQTEEGGAFAHNPYTNEIKKIPGVKRYEKPGKPGSPVEIADENNQPIWTSPENAIGKKRPNPTVMVPGFDAQGNQVTIPVPKYPKPGQGNIPKQPGIKPRPKPPRLPDDIDMGVIGGSEPPPSAPPPENTGDEGAFVPPQRSLLDKFMLSGTAYAEEDNRAQLLGGRERSPIIPVAASPDAPAKGIDTSKIKFGTPYLRRDATREGPQGKPTELPSVKTVDLEGNPIEIKRRVYENGEEEVEFYRVMEKASATDKKVKKEEEQALTDIDAQLKLLNDMESQFDGYKKKNPISFEIATTPVVGDVFSPVKQIGDEDLEALDQTMDEFSLKKIVDTMTGLSKNFDTAKEAKNLNAIKFKIARGETTTRQMIKRVRENLESVKSKLTGSFKGAPPVGTVVDGYKFKGGNHKDQKNWEEVE